MPAPFQFACQLNLTEDFDSLLSEALAAENAGFDSVTVPDHFWAPGEGIAADAGRGEAWTTLAALGARTTRVRVGGSVMCNLFRHPCLTAQLTATLDVITHGRAELGLGAGWMLSDFTRTGIPYPPIGPRIRMLDEALTVIGAALRGETVDFEGEFYSVHGFQQRPLPVQQRVPIHIGGGGDKLLGVAARHADLVSLVSPAVGGRIDPAEVRKLTPERFGERVAFLRKAAEQAGRDPEAIAAGGFVLTRLTGSPAETAKAAQALAAIFGGDEKAVRQSPLTLMGTPAEIVEELERRRERYGMRWVLLSGRPSRETLEVFGKEVIPRLKAVA
jgi:probable F420-dependent oxidoreductase